MPQMGVSVAEGTIVAWRIGVGDAIEAEQTIVEISTDKIDSEVPSPVSGVLAEILVEPDQTVEVGTVLGRIAVGAGAAGTGAERARARSARGDSRAGPGTPGRRPGRPTAVTTRRSCSGSPPSTGSTSRR